MRMTMIRTRWSEALHDGFRRCVCIALAFCALALTLRAQAAFAETAYVVTETGSLVRFETSAGAGTTNIGVITGLVGASPILSLDFRPSTGRLYGITADRLYIIDPATAVAQPVSAAPFPTLITGNPDMDFDPVSGLIRVVTDTNQNMRINADTGVQTSVDTAISGVTGIAAIAFNNNFASPDRATLYGISHTADQLVRIGGVNLPDGGASQNGGVATAVGGGLTVTTQQILSLDIAANDNEAFAVLADAAAPSALYKINLTTGAATFVRNIFLADRARGLALVSRAVTLYGLTSPTASAPGGAIITVLSAVPGTLLPMPSGAPVPITGLTSGEEVLAIDTRPSTGDLVGVTSTGRLLRINPVNGQSLFMAQVSVAFSGNVAGFDFSPNDGQLRITTDTGQNLSVVPDTGAATQETNLNIPGTVALAYTAAGALYGIDEATDTLTFFATPSTGGGAPVLALGTDVGPLTSFDVSVADGTGFAAITAPGGTTTRLFAISLPDGATLPVADFGGGTTIRGLAVARPGRVSFPTTTYSALESAGLVPITLVREAGSSGPITVKLTAAAGTATSPADFTGFSSTVEFADGETTKTINIVVQNDPTDELDETVLLTLTQPFLGATIGTAAAATLTIVDNDPSGGGQPPTVTITTPTANQNFTASTLFLTLSGTAADPDGTIQSVTWTNDRGFTGTASIGPAAASVDWFATDVQLAPGVNTITVIATDNANNQASDTIVVTVNDLSYFLAEGATGSFFDLDLLLANPNSTPVNITATFLKPSGQGTVVQQYTLPATSRTTINVETITGLENAEVSTIVTAPAATPIVVERTMRWDTTGYGAHTDKASPSTSTKWYFAEGSQGFFFTYLLLANPQNAANQATVKYLREGASTITRVYPLNPLQRFTVDIGADADLVNNSFGMEVTFTLPGIAERAMYFGLNPLWIGGHESVGVTLPSRNWFLAEGATGTFFETFVLFANPSATDASVAVRYLPASGQAIDKTYPLPAGQRLTVNIEAEDPTLANAAVATQVTSTVPIIVERAQYWPDPAQAWYEAHNSFGVTSTGTRWGLAEGRVGLGAGYQTYILLANPNNNAVDVSITFLREDGTTLIKTYNGLQPLSRFNVAVGGPEVPEITNGSFSAVITASHPIAVERAMYSDRDGVVWQAGTNATATRLP
jgi:Domain of unknown function (DUF4394)/Calx-beta domain/Bacterial Ig domain